MTVDPKTARILLVEDAPVMRKIEIKTLRKLGFVNIAEASDGNGAITHLEGGAPVDLIISDWNMPNRDGLELLTWLRTESRWPELPFLMATGQGDKKQVQKAVDAGVSSFVAKPFNEEELRQKIEEAFGRDEGAGAPIVDRGPRTTADGKVKLRVAHIQITDHIILGALKHHIEKGLVAPEHFELETVCMAGWNPVQNALETGAVDAAFILAPIAMDLFSVGTPIRLTLLAHKSGSIFVRNRTGDFRAPYAEFFKGKTFYIPHKMSVHHMLAHLFFSNIGLNPGMVGEGESDVHFEIVAPIKMPEFLAATPSAGGFMVAEPLGTKAIAGGIAELQFLSSELWESHPCCVVAMREDFIGPYAAATHEFTHLLVDAGQFVEKKPDMAAEIAVRFLDPQGTLGLKVPILKNVLRERRGIRTGDLYPDVESLKQMNDYMFRRMGIGSQVDMDAFVDTRFADAACEGRGNGFTAAVLHDRDARAAELLDRSASIRLDGDKSNLGLEGKYLSFGLGAQEYGIDILRIKEIIGAQKTRSMPQSPDYITGVFNLRGTVVPVMDLKRRFNIGSVSGDVRTCIIVIETGHAGAMNLIGLAVDSVSEVLTIRANDIVATPFFGTAIDTRHILAMAKVEGRVRQLLNIDHLLAGSEVHRAAA
ncbi:MAG: chemotaxis protein CheW [Pseudomonadota bacterium]